MLIVLKATLPREEKYLSDRLLNYVLKELTKRKASLNSKTRLLYYLCLKKSILFKLFD